MSVTETIKEILGELLDVDPDTIGPDTFLIRDLGAESIDLLELAVSLNAGFGVPVEDDAVFLTRFRQHHDRTLEKGEDPLSLLSGTYPFLSLERIREIISEKDKGPALKVKDIAAYIEYRQKT